MEKKNFILGDAKPETFKYDGQVIQVIPYLSYEEMKTLIHVYIMEATKTSDTIGGGMLAAELSTMANLVDLKTDVLMFEDDGKTVMTIDNLLSNMELFSETIKRIKNYDLFRELLTKALEQYKFEQSLEASLGKTLQTIAAKTTDLIETLASFDASDEKIEKIRSLAAEVNEMPVLQEAVTLFKSRKKTTRKKTAK